MHKPRASTLCCVVGCSLLTMDGGASAQQEIAKLRASDGAADDRFGVSVSVSGNTAVVGAYRDDDRGTDSGSAYVFERIGGEWTQVAKLTASDGAEDDWFGGSVSVAGDTALVGAVHDDDRGADSGSAYIFERIGGVWTQVAKLTAHDGAERDGFAYTVAVSGDSAVVGAYFDDDRGESSGSAYVFEKVGGTWSQAAKLTASDGEAGDVFGYAVSLSGNTAVMGAYGEDDGGESSGSAYVFERVGGAWTQMARLKASDAQASDYFGYKVAVSGDTVLVGAVGNDDPTYNAGSAYVFERAGGVWRQVAELTADDGAEEDFFGGSVAVSGDTALVGVRYDDDRGIDSGSAFVFHRVGGVWSQRAKLKASDGMPNDRFGLSVALSGDAALVGALLDDDLGTDSGSAYAFDVGTCAPDFNDDGVLDTRDFIDFLDAWARLDQAADWDGNGVIDTRDVVAFLNSWAAGC